MYSPKELLEIVEKEIKCLNLPDQPNDLYEPIKYIVSIGGKRLRPVITLLSCNVFSEDIDNAIKPSIGLELFHNFTLIHDDIMDNALIRRGQQTIHSKWNENIAILSGDALNIIAYMMISETPSRFISQVLKIFNDTALKVCEGQQYDMDFESSEKVSENEYLKMIELKTSVLVAACMKIGAIIGNASQQYCDNMYLAGLNFGLAFQLQDDFLDTFGDEKIFGKEIGKDIISNKKTYLLIKALEISNKIQLAELNKWLSAKNFDNNEKISKVKTLFEELHIDILAKQKINEYFSIAMKYLDLLGSKERIKTLKSYIESLYHRQN